MTNNLPKAAFILLLAAPAVASAEPASDGGEIEVAAVAVSDAEQAGDAVVEPLDAVAQADGDVSEEGDDGDDDAEADSKFELPFSISAQIGLSHSLGTISRPNFQTTDSVLTTYGLGLGYEFTDGFSGSIDAGFSKFVTPHGQIEQYEARVSDIGVGLSYAPVYVIPRADIGISASLSGSIPISRQSRWENNYTNLSAGLAFSRSFGNLSLSYALGATKAFHQFTSIVVDRDRYENLDLFFRESDSAGLASNQIVLGSGLLTEWVVRNSISARYTWIKGLSTTIGFSLADAFSYAPQERVAEIDVTGDGVPDEIESSDFAEPGRGRSQAMTGSIGLGYSFREHFSTGLTVATTGAPKTADNRRIRVPWLDLETGNLSRTSFRWSFGVSY